MTLEHQKALKPGDEVYDPHDGENGTVVAVTLFIGVWIDWQSGPLRRAFQWFGHNVLGRSEVKSLVTFKPGDRIVDWEGWKGRVILVTEDRIGVVFDNIPHSIREYSHSSTDDYEWKLVERPRNWRAS